MTRRKRCSKILLLHMRCFQIKKGAKISIDLVRKRQLRMNRKMLHVRLVVVGAHSATFLANKWDKRMSKLDLASSWRSELRLRNCMKEATLRWVTRRRLFALIAVEVVEMIPIMSKHAPSAEERATSKLDSRSCQDSSKPWSRSAPNAKAKEKSWLLFATYAPVIN